MGGVGFVCAQLNSDAGGQKVKRMGGRERGKVGRAEGKKEGRESGGGELLVKASTRQ